MPKSAAALLTAALDELVTPEAAAAFDEQGYLVFSPAATAQANWEEGATTFLHEIKTCHNVFHATSPNKVEFLTTNGPVQLVKPNIFEFDLHDHQSDVRKELRAFDALLSTELHAISSLLRSRCATLRTLISEGDAGGAGGMEKHVTVKMQVNEGGCFPWHYDNPGPPNKRLLTLAVYLTPGWDAKDGGELVLQPFLGPEIRIPPAMMTIALFRSDTICHRVRPFNKSSNTIAASATNVTTSGAKNNTVESADISSLGEDRNKKVDEGSGSIGGSSYRPTRYCFTIWFDGSSTNRDEDVNIRQKHLQDSFIDALKVSPLQRTLSRAVYSEAYKQALEECFGEGSKELRLSIMMHDAHCKNLLGNAQARTFVEDLRRRFL